MRREKRISRRSRCRREKYMVRAREIWEEIGLPKLQSQEPWHGYLMGLWPQELAEEADLAAQSEHEKIWEKLKQTRLQVGEGETLKPMRAKWDRMHSGRSE
jgi:hypothetical protein